MLLLPRNHIAELLFSEMPGVRMPAMWSANQYACPKLSQFRKHLRPQVLDTFAALGIRPGAGKTAGKPICDVFSKGLNFLLNVDCALTAEVWHNGVDTAAAVFGLRVILPPGVDFLGLSSPVGGGHDTGVLVVEDDADQKDGKPRVYHIEPQTIWDCPLGESLARDMMPVELRD